MSQVLFLKLWLDKSDCHYKTYLAVCADSSTKILECFSELIHKQLPDLDMTIDESDGV